MRIAILSDIHANRPALEAVLADSQEWDVEHFWCLGDVVGYGPHPVAPLMFLKCYVEADGWVMGNHDAMLADLLLPDDLRHKKPKDILHAVTDKGKGVKVTARGRFLTLDDWARTNSEPIIPIELNRAALAAHAEAEAFWQTEFKPERKTPHLVHRDGIDHILVHASQSDLLTRYVYAWHHEAYLPTEFTLLKQQSAERNFPRVQWYGHTHVPTFVRAKSKSGESFEFEPVRVFPGETHPLPAEIALVNPGSVGQPRDLDQRAAYAILDTAERTVTFRRVAYDWRETAHGMLAGGYPESLVNRLKTAAADEKVTPDDWLDHYREAAKR